MAKQTLPTDQYIEPDDFEFYLLGAMEGRDKSKLNSSPTDLGKGTRLEGSFGHSIPK
jgi:pilus assembly protein CpaC